MREAKRLVLSKRLSSCVVEDIRGTIHEIALRLVRDGVAKNVSAAESNIRQCERNLYNGRKTVYGYKLLHR